MKTLNKCLSILLCLLLLAGLCAPAALAASEEKSIIRIYTADDLCELARQCTLDTWSQDKTVLLQQNIDLSLTDFSPIPTFGGTFDGQGYTISGLNLRADGEVRGLFRYIQPTGIVQNLTVEGTILPANFKDRLGGIAGSNGGSILNCVFRGKIYGTSTIGGIAGINEASGQIVNCRFAGSITGEHYVGGIAGQNLGSIVQCQNSGSINTVEVNPPLDIDKIELGNLNNTEAVPAATDIGGIAGFSSGIIQSCRNLGDIGYPHVGYNVGGIAGRQSGYLGDCINEGLVQGRKDVGGIAGQMEPQLMLKYDQSALDKLWGELSTLESMIDDVLEDTFGAADHLTDEIQALSDSVSSVKGAVTDLSDSIVDWADGNLSQINDLSARFSWALERVVPVADAVAQTIAQMELAADQLSDGLSETSDAAEYGAQTFEEMSLASSDMQTATQFIQSAFAKMRTAMNQLEQALGDSAAAEQNINSLADAISDMTRAISSITVNLKQIQTSVDNLYQWASDPISLDQLERAVKELGSAAEEITTALEAILATLQNSDPLDPALLDSLQLLSPGLEKATQAIGDINTALRSLEGEFPTQETDRIRTAVDAIADDLIQVGIDAQKFGSALNALVENADLQSLENALTSVKECLSALETSAYSLSLSLGHLEQAMDLLEDAALELSTALDTFSQAGSTMADGLALLEQAVSDTKSIVDELSQMPTIQFTLLEGSVTDAGEALSMAADEFLNSFNALNAALRSESGFLTDDLQEINAQVGTIVDTLHQLQTEEQEKESGDLLDDVSSQDSDNKQSSGKISACENLGTVEGDLNVAGIVGAMAIEYDFDPEDDLTISGSRTLDFSYLAKAVVYGSINRGSVTAKKNSVGGIAGSMDLGLVTACQGYGSVTSTSGSYVGGIAGEAYGRIVDCWAKCTLSGSNYIGGIAGLGTYIQNCRTLICFDSNAPFVGAVAGQVEEGAELSGNYFVHPVLAGIDGISYQGLAEPMSYDTFCELEHLPVEFRQFELIFTADGKTIATIPFRYGDALTQLPDIPEKTGYYAQWPDVDYSFLSFSQTLDAQYIPYATTLSDGLTPPNVLVSGSFSPDAQLTVTSSTEEWNDVDGNFYCGTAYTVTVTDGAAESIPYTIHWRLPEKGSYDLWIFNGTDWVRQAYTPDGSYLLLECTGTSITFCLIESVPLPVIIFILAAAAVILIIIIVIVAVRVTKKRKKPVAAAENTP